jgi:hypothetical protein
MADINFDSDKLKEEKKEKRQFADRAASYRMKKAWTFVLSSPEGKMVMYELLEEAKVYSTPYSGEVHLTHVNIGKQDIGRHILNMIDIAKPSALLEMIRESKSNKVREESINQEIEETKEI